MEDQNLQSLDFELIVSSTLVRSVVSLESTTSTNDDAKRVAADKSHALPALIYAHEQTAGRGQQGNLWWSGPGSLTCSLVLDDRQISDPSRLPVATALAIVRAVAGESSSLNPQTKWPNDVFVSGRKIAGILIETWPQGDRKLYVLGIGVNTNCDLEDSGPEIKMTAISLSTILRRRIDQQRFLIGFLHALGDCLQLSDRQPDSLMSEYLASSVFQPNEKLTLKAARGAETTGNFAGFGRSGELRLKIGSEIWETATGHVVRPVIGVDNSATTGN